MKAAVHRIVWLSIASSGWCVTSCDPSPIHSTGPVSSAGGSSSSGGSGGTDGFHGAGGFIEFGVGGVVSDGGRSCYGLVWGPLGVDAGAGDAGERDGGNGDAGRRADASGLEASVDASGDESCTLSLVRSPEFAPLDLNKMSVTISLGESMQGFIVQVPSCDSDAGAFGYTFDDINQPSALILCPALCARYRTERLSVTAHFRCFEYNPW